MILLIDNYDSFTYNLYQYLSELGAEVSVVRNDETSIESITDMAPEKIVVSPGPSTPDKAGISTEVIRHFGATTPTLGVCLGMVGTYGFTVLAMLIPAISAFDVALGRTTADKG